MSSSARGTPFRFLLRPWDFWQKFYIFTDKKSVHSFNNSEELKISVAWRCSSRLKCWRKFFVRIHHWNPPTGKSWKQVSDRINTGYGRNCVGLWHSRGNPLFWLLYLCYAHHWHVSSENVILTKGHRGTSPPKLGRTESWSWTKSTQNGENLHF